MTKKELLFGATLIVSFCLPSNRSFGFTFGFLQIEFREIAFIFLPLINVFLVKNRYRNNLDKNTRYGIFYFLFFIFFTEILKNLIVDHSYLNAMRSIRFALPLISSFILLYQGLRMDALLLWKFLVCAVGMSCVVSLISIFIELPIYKLTGGTIFDVYNGRLYNDNFSFGFIALVMMLFSSKNIMNIGFLVRTSYLLSIIILLLAFNRTYLLLCSIILLFYVYRNFNVKTIVRKIPTLSLAILLVALTYSRIQIVKNQFDQRIIGTLQSFNDFYSNVVEDNRDIIFEGVQARLSEGYWLFGLSYNTPIYSYYKSPLVYQDHGIVYSVITDTSLVNILVRYGIIPFSLFVYVFGKIIRSQTSSLGYLVIIGYLMVSLNIDSLLNHNSIFFMTIFLLVINRKNILKF